MTSDETSPPAPPTVADAVRARLQEATPLTLKELAKGLSTPEKARPAQVLSEVRQVVEEEVQKGRAFSAPSGKKGEPRFWGRDERQHLRDRAMELCVTPTPLPGLSTKLKKEVKGVDGAFVEGVARELVGEGLLFEHPPKKAGGPALIGTSPPPPPPPPLSDLIHVRLQEAAAPLTVKEAGKGVPNPQKLKAPELEAEVRRNLNEAVGQGRAFSSLSGKKGELRYWSRDEKHLLRERAVELCASPQPLTVLQKGLGRAGTGADAAFIESVVRELVAEDRLFAHAAAGKKGGPLFGASPPPPERPPLEKEANKKKVADLVKKCRDLMDKARVSAEELLGALATHLSGAVHEVRPGAATVETPPVAGHALGSAPGHEGRPGAALEELILRAVSNAPVLSLADLRRDMPAEMQGREFDEVVLRLADEQRVTVSQDADPTSFSDAERGGYVRDGAVWFTMISKRD